MGYVDDRRYAEALVERRLQQGRGRQLIGRELEHKGLGDEVVGEAVRAVDPSAELESACELAARLVRRHAAEAPERARQKVLSALARRGFTSGVARRALEQALATQA